MTEIDHVPSAEEILAAAEDPAPEAGTAPTDPAPPQEPEPAPAPQGSPGVAAPRRAFICENQLSWTPPGAREGVYVAEGTEGSWTQDEIDSLLAQGAKLRPVLPTKAERLAKLKAEQEAIEALPDEDAPPVAAETPPAPAESARAKPKARKPKATR